MLTGLNFVLAHVADIETAKQFYIDTFGLEIETQAPNFVQFKPAQGGATYALSVEDGKRNVELWWFVDNADAAYAELTGRGAETVEPLADQPFGRAFAIKDPAGHTLYMLQPS